MTQLIVNKLLEFGLVLVSKTNDLGVGHKHFLKDVDQLIDSK